MFSKKSIFSFLQAQVAAFLGGITDYGLMILLTEVFQLHFTLKAGLNQFCILCSKRFIIFGSQILTKLEKSAFWRQIIAVKLSFCRKMANNYPVKLLSSISQRGHDGNQFSLYERFSGLSACI